jgi:hypothetical protein
MSIKQQQNNKTLVLGSDSRRPVEDQGSVPLLESHREALPQMPGGDSLVLPRVAGQRRGELVSLLDSHRVPSAQGLRRQGTSLLKESSSTQEACTEGGITPSRTQQASRLTMSSLDIARHTQVCQKWV